MALSEKEIIEKLEDYSKKATALAELRKNGANYLSHFDSFQANLRVS